MSDKEAVIRFVWFMAKNSNLELSEVLTLMRLAKTFRRLDTELTNGYKRKNGSEDTECKAASHRKLDKVCKRMEAICKISFGALTVSVVVASDQSHEGREVYIP